MNLAKINEMTLLKKASFLAAGVLILAVIFFLIRGFIGTPEEEPVSRVHSKKGQTVIELTTDEQSLNDIKVEKPETILYQPIRKVRGWRVPLKELGFYISPPQLAKIPDTTSYAYIEIETNQSRLKEVPAKVSVSLGKGLSVEAEKVDADNHLLMGAKILYRFPEKEMPETPVEEVTLEIPEGPSVKASIVPESAMVWSEGKAWVYAAENDGVFIRREISILNSEPQESIKYQNSILILENKELENGIVVQGAQQLLSEESIAELDESAE